MGSNSRKKERQRLKRQQKRRAMHRAEGLNPYRRFASQGEVVVCYVNNDWHKQGMAEILALKQVAGGNLAFGAYLVDIWCVGLKDAWGRVNVTQADFTELVDRTREHLEMVRIDPAAAWAIVSGGVRFARQNGFRLPPRYERWTALLGNNAECGAADLSQFGVEGGKLRYVGTMEDLRKRLIGCRPEEFLKREDVEFIVRDRPWDDEYEEDEVPDDEEFDEQDDADMGDLEETEDELELAVAYFRLRAMNAVRKWCFATGRRPHPRLQEAVDLLVESILQLGDLTEDEEALDASAARASDNLDTLLSLEMPSQAAHLQEAVNQLNEFCQQFRSPEELCIALGIEPMDDEHGDDQ